MKLVIIAPRGKMGRLIVQSGAKRDGFKWIAGVAPKGREYIGMDLGDVAMVGHPLGVPVVDDLETVIDQCDMVIDFSTKECSLQVLDCALRHKKALICGTTGFDAEEMKRFQDASKEIPLLFAANTSKMVNLMQELLAAAAKVLGDQVDVEILEMHDRQKKDVPSGTAKEMGETIAHAQHKALDTCAVFGREAGENPRKAGTIAFHSVRAGNWPSSHTVIFGGMGERLEISHHAYDWVCFAEGACDAAAFLFQKEAGLYGMEDVLQQP